MNKISMGIGIVALISIILSLTTDNIVFEITTSAVLAILFTISAIEARKDDKKGAMIFYSFLAIVGYIVTFLEFMQL